MYRYDIQVTRYYKQEFCISWKFFDDSMFKRTKLYLF